MHFLIAGIPASGKSTFYRWLEEKKGFLHLDVEKPGVLDRYGLATAWDALFDAGASAGPCIEALEMFKRPSSFISSLASDCRGERVESGALVSAKPSVLLREACGQAHQARTSPYRPDGGPMASWRKGKKP